MFTGIVEETGTIRKAGRSSLEIEAHQSLQNTQVGDSISVDGACLTVTTLGEDSFVVDLTPETLRRTNLGLLEERDMVNLERALRPDQRMGGHFVQGHVDGTGKLVSLTEEGESTIVEIEAPHHILRYVVEKGFIAMDGISFTVTHVNSGSFKVSLIPYTRENTNMGQRRVGDLVNLEVDIIGKYVERLLEAHRA